MPRVIGPTRPKNINVTSTSCPATGSWAVIPVDSPTVPNADKASNSSRARPYGATATRTSVATSTAVSAMTVTARAWRTAAYGIRPAEGLHVGVAAHLGPHREREH